MEDTKFIHSQIGALVLGYIGDLAAELYSVGGDSLAEGMLAQAYDDALVLKTGGSTPTVAWATDILTTGVAVDVDDEFQAMKFMRHVVMNASEADFAAQIVNGTLLNVASLAPQELADGTLEDLSTLTIAEKILRCVENINGDLDRQTVSYTAMISNIREALA